MIEVGIEVERVILFEEVTEFRCYSLRQDYRNPAADPDDLHVRNVAEPTEQMVQFRIGQHERIAAGEDDIADFRVRGNIVKCGIPVRLCTGERLTQPPLAHAEAAIDSTLVRDEPDHPVGVAVDQTRHRGEALFVKWVGKLVVLKLPQIRHALPPDGVTRFTDEGKVVGRNAHRVSGRHRIKGDRVDSEAGGE
jgi:hypothetical protein